MSRSEFQVRPEVSLVPSRLAAPPGTRYRARGIYSHAAAEREAPHADPGRVRVDYRTSIPDPDPRGRTYIRVRGRT